MSPQTGDRPISLLGYDEDRAGVMTTIVVRCVVTVAVAEVTERLRAVAARHRPRPRC